MATEYDIAGAETFNRERRLSNVKLLQLDETKVGGAGELAARIMRLAEADPLKFDAMLGKAEVAKLFACGALHFGRNSQ